MRVSPAWQVSSDDRHMMLHAFVADTLFHTSSSRLRNITFICKCRNGYTSISAFSKTKVLKWSKTSIFWFSIQCTIIEKKLSLVSSHIAVNMLLQPSGCCTDSFLPLQVYRTVRRELKQHSSNSNYKSSIKGWSTAMHTMPTITFLLVKFPFACPGLKEMEILAH